MGYGRIRALDVCLGYLHNFSSGVYTDVAQFDDASLAFEGLEQALSDANRPNNPLIQNFGGGKDRGGAPMIREWIHRPVTW